MLEMPIACDKFEIELHGTCLYPNVIDRYRSSYLFELRADLSVILSRCDIDRQNLDIPNQAIDIAHIFS